MNEANIPDRLSDVPWHTGVPQVREPDASRLPGSEMAAELLKGAAQGAHDTIDHLADSAQPAVRKLGESVSAAGETLHAKTDQLRETRDEWIEAARSNVRSMPLGAVAAAFALGAVFARITR